MHIGKWRTHERFAPCCRTPMAGLITSASRPKIAGLLVRYVGLNMAAIESTANSVTLWSWHSRQSRRDCFFHVSLDVWLKPHIQLWFIYLSLSLACSVYLFNHCLTWNEGVLATLTCYTYWRIYSTVADWSPCKKAPRSFSWLRMIPLIPLQTQLWR